jgi:demethylmenaquinone methyltransferase/2-methoxy-6-polyprenyl-1,4-benzoquinol methylase
MNHVKPYHSSGKSKKEEVADMFDNISSRYDFLNRFLSLGIDVSWRKKTVKEVNRLAPTHVLDMATGTADLAIMMAKNGVPEVTGADLSAGMLGVGQKKINEKSLEHKITLIQADSENLPFDSERFDAATVAFGVRNFENTVKGLSELHRVLKADGRLFVLEFSKPEKFPFKQVYGFYFRHILPRWGRIISGDHAAYTYLPESVNAFPYGKEFMQLANQAGFRGGRFIPLTFGIASLYILEK